MKKKRWTLILLGSFLFILLIQLSIPCWSQTYIGPERTPPQRSTYKKVVWPLRFALKLPLKVLHYTSKGIVLGVTETEIISTYRDVFFNEAETIGLYPMPSLSPSSGLGGGLVFFYDDFISPGMDFEIETNLTSTMEQEVELSLKQPQWMNDKLYTNFLVKYDYDPDRDFYGIDFDSKEEIRTNFSLRTINAEVDFGTNITSTIHVGGNLGYLWTDNGPGESSSHKSIREGIFADDDIPAFGETLSFLVPKLSLVHDNTKPLGRPHWGGREEFTVALYHELTDKGSRFTHWRLELSRYLHLFRERTLAARIRMAMNSSTEEEYEVPFFLRNQLGGGDTLRGYNTGRFADKDLVLATLEYRFPVWRHPSTQATQQVDARIFVDAGRVFSDIFEEFTLSDTKICGGFGLRFSTEEDFIFRLEIAKSSEQLSAIFKQESVF